LSITKSQVPSSCRCATSALCPSTFIGLPSGPGTLQHPLRRRQGDASSLGERPRLERHPGLHCEKAAERFADSFGTRNDLAGPHHEGRRGLIELDHGLDVAGVDRLDEQHVKRPGALY
jgi:hypothetical protein